MRVTRHTFITDSVNVRIAFVSDLHNEPYDALLEGIRGEKADIILVGGDFVHDRSHTETGFAFLRAAAAVAPTFCALGNHELKAVDRVEERIAATGAVLLDNDFICFGGLVIGGLTSGFSGLPQGRFKKTPAPRMDWLPRFCEAEGVHVLLSHHPEYYPRYLCELPAELVLSGHAHGGQWRLFGRGVFAPGQGLFPRFTAGVYRGGKRARKPLALTPTAPLLLVSRGLSNHSVIPRFNNPREWHLLTLIPKEE